MMNHDEWMSGWTLIGLLVMVLLVVLISKVSRNKCPFTNHQLSESLSMKGIVC